MPSVTITSTIRITQEDYYRLFAYLNDTNETNIAVYTPAEQKKRAEVLQQNPRHREYDLKKRTPDWRKQMDEWEAQRRQRPAAVDGG